MGLYKRGKVWWIDYYYPPGRDGKRIREKIGPRKNDAAIVYSERLKDIRQGRNPELRRIDPKPFEDMVSEFLKRYAKKLRSADTLRRQTETLMRSFRGRTLQEITPKHIEQHVADRLADRIAPATANRERAALSNIFNRPIAWGYYGGTNPVQRVKPLREPKGRFRYLTADEADALEAEAARHLRPLIIAGVETGGRLSELRGLKWQDVDFARGVVTFDQTNTKGEKTRRVPLSPRLRETLKALGKVRTLRRGPPCGPGSVGAGQSDAAHAAALVRQLVHDQRRRPVPLAEVPRTRGH